MRYALVCGAIAGAIVVSTIIAGLALDLPSHFHSEWFGYLVMLVALSLLFVGVKRYRDVECGGVIGFGRAFAVGLGIAAVAGVVYVTVWEIYVAISGIDYMAEYAARTLAEMRAAGADAAALAAKAKEMQDMVEMLRNPLLRIPITFAEIFPVGLAVALVSALILRNPRAFPRRV